MGNIFQILRNYFDTSYFSQLSPKIFSHIEDTIEDTIVIDSQIIPEADLPKGYPRLLCTDQVLVIPSDTSLRVLVTSNDVIHS
jgi:heme/copper-type cytochrome/quinol oxidase subunit 2